MTENQPPDREVDDLGPTSEDWQDLQIRLQLRHVRSRSGTVEAEAFRRMTEYARSEAERVAAAEAADEAWRATRPDRAPQAEPEPEAGQ